MGDGQPVRDDPLGRKSFAFAVRIVNLNKHLHSRFTEYVLSKQLLRSGTAIGALIREAARAESKSDSAHKMNISLKEADETWYCLELLQATEYLTTTEFDSLRIDLDELRKLLTVTVKTSRAGVGKV